MKRLLSSLLTVLLLVPAAQAEDSSVDVDGFFDKNNVSQGMAGDGFAVRRPKKPIQTAPTRTQLHQARAIEKLRDSQGFGQKETQRRNTNAVTPQVEGVSAPANFGPAVQPQLPPPPAVVQNTPQEAGDWSRQMKQGLDAIQLEPGSRQNQSYYEDMLKKLEKVDPAAQQEQKKKEDGSHRF